MKKTTIIKVNSTLILLCLFLNFPNYSQNLSSEKDKFLNHWVNYYEHRQDTLFYIPSTSELAKDLSIETKGSGITFKYDGTYSADVWKLCGNDTSPDAYSGSWQLSFIDGKTILTILYDPQHPIKYSILELTANKIILVPYY